REENDVLLGSIYNDNSVIIAPLEFILDIFLNHQRQEGGSFPLHFESMSKIIELYKELYPELSYNLDIFSDINSSFESGNRALSNEEQEIIQELSSTLKHSDFHHKLLAFAKWLDVDLEFAEGFNQLTSKLGILYNYFYPVHHDAIAVMEIENSDLCPMCLTGDWEGIWKYVELGMSYFFDT
ncbi:MAG: hypothetical protein SFT91_06015, partial [Rickettsiaceae bacterium]|nr:hypothetical protein [Rickettsiaceae bacterium]